MFCDQCEQTSRAHEVLGCTLLRGTCGKDDRTAVLQDFLVHQLTNLARYATRVRALGKPDDDAAAFLTYGLYNTLTNVNFDGDRIIELIHQSVSVRDRVRASYAGLTGSVSLDQVADLLPAADPQELLEQAEREIGPRGLSSKDRRTTDLLALILYGLKGMCAYTHHARTLGFSNPDLDASLEQFAAFLAEGQREADVDDEYLLEQALSLGRANLEAMRLLDEAHTTTFGTPTPTPVRLTAVEGPAILVSGHDLPTLQAVLERTNGTGIRVYTHGELLPAHGYPNLRAYEHLIGNYGGAWQDQLTDFARFPGPIVMTSNCLIRPRPVYQDRIFTTGPVGWPGVRHLQDGDFEEVIQSALASPGFERTEPEKSITVGFGHEAVLGVADALVKALRTGTVRRLFVIGGCDGASGARDYYSRYAVRTPSDTIVATLGCAKYRFNRHEFGQVAGLPRLLDLGQCNDAYSAIRIVTALSEALDSKPDELPVSLVLSWFEQKAVAVLLTLLSLGMKNISLGPTLPTYLTPATLALLNERFGLRTITDPDVDRATELEVSL